MRVMTGSLTRNESRNGNLITTFKVKADCGEMKEAGKGGEKGPAKRTS